MTDVIKATPRHDYQAVLADLCQQVLELPEDVKHFAYDFKAFCEKHFPGDFDKSIETERRFNLRGDFYGDSLHIKYTVRVKVETRSCYHNDTETTRILYVEIAPSQYVWTHQERLPYMPETK